MSAYRPDLHTPEHDQWDQGGYCNNLVLDDDGCGTVCGYRAPRERSCQRHDREPSDAEVEAAAAAMWDRWGHPGMFPHAPAHRQNSFLADARAALIAAQEVRNHE